MHFIALANDQTYGTALEDQSRLLKVMLTRKTFSAMLCHPLNIRCAPNEMAFLEALKTK